MGFPDGSTTQPLFTMSFGNPLTPTWSPDETTWAFSLQGLEHEEIFSTNDTSGLTATQLTPDDQGDSFYPSWTRH